jgi:signal transduction histidine kinase
MSSDLLTDPGNLQENFHDFFENSLCGFVIADTRGFIIRANNTVASWVNCTSNEITGRRFSDLLSIGGKIYYETHLSPLLRMQGFFDEVVLEISSKNGNKIRVMVNALERKDNDGKPFFIRFTLLQARDRLQYEQNLQDANVKMNETLIKQNSLLEKQNEELNSFTFIASHDLKEPIRKIEMFTSRIFDTEAENFSPKCTEYFRSILTATKRMQNLIDAVLSYAQVDILHYLEPTDLNEILRQVTESLKEQISETDARIISAPLPTVQAIPEQMEQLFTNLLSNAIKYSKSDTPPIINISVEKIIKVEMANINFKGSFYKVDFADNGIGFDEKQKHKIFEIFQRLHKKSEYSGTGIGLSICKKIVEKHEGFITVESCVGIGSVFSILLPDKNAKVTPIT